MAAEETTHVRVYDDDVNRLHARKGRGDKIADVVQRALDATEPDAPLNEQKPKTEETA